MQHHHDHGGDEDERILYTVEDWTPKGVVNTIWSFARTGVSPPPYLMQRLMARAEETVCAFSPPELSTFCWSLASIKHRPSKSLIAVIQERFEETHTAYHGRQVCDIIWAISVLQPFVFKETFLRTLEARATHLVADLDSSQGVCARGRATVTQCPASITHKGTGRPTPSLPNTRPQYPRCSGRLPRSESTQTLTSSRFWSRLA